MKPHEETWEARANGSHSFVVFPSGGNMLVKYDPGNYTEEEGFQRAKLASLAPEMARALLKLVSTSCQCVVGCSCEHGKAQTEAEALLRAAGW